MKRWELFALQIFAVVCSYLILSITFASAFEIRIYTFDNQELTTELLEFSDFIQKEFSYPYLQNYQHVKIKLSSKSPSYLISKVYLFACKGLDPVQCIENGIQPAVSVNTGSSSFIFDQTYRWNDVSSNDVANFLIFTKLDVGGKEVWTGSWNKAVKTGVSDFDEKSYSMDRLNIYLKSGISEETVKSYIDNYYSIPSDRMNHSVFQTISGTSVEKLYDLSGNKNDIDPSGTGIPNFYTGTFSGNVFDNSLRTWDFIFGSDGKIANPVVFYSSEAGPPTISGANLVIDDLSPQVITCGSDEVVRTSMHVENASNIGYYQSYYYEIDGIRASEGSIICSIINPNQSIYSYECSIPVADFPVCNAPGSSTITFYFDYQGGVKLSAGFPITLKAPKPKLIVNSVIPNPFDCGIDTELTSQIRVINPMGVTPETYYTFDGTNFQPLECSGSGSLYTCKIYENDICPLLQENLELTFKFVYDDIEVLPPPTELFVTFPPPNLGIDTVTPQMVEAGKTTSVNVLLHVNYPDFLTYDEDDFNYKYLNKAFQPVTCSLESSYTNIKYYKCTISLAIPSDEEGVKTLAFRLDGFMEGEPEQLTANTFFEILPPPPEPSFTITSTSSPVDCVTDDVVSFTIKYENIDFDDIEKQEFTYDGINYNPITCTKAGNLLQCSHSADELCGEMKNVLTVIFSFTDANNTYYTNPQKVYFKIPEPHMQVYSIQPNTLSIGEKNSVTVNLYVQYPKMVGESPIFLYSYLDKTNQKMSCNKVSSTSIRDFYDCANTDFEVPADYSKSQLPVLFSIQGTTISFPMNIPVETLVKTTPWLEIVSTTPSRIEILLGNQTSASFYVTVHNAAEKELKHQATLIPNSWITSGSCKEEAIEYDFTCDVTIKPPTTAKTGPNSVTLSLKVSNSKTYDISNQTTVYVLPEETLVEIQSISPNTLYCEGHKQQNPNTVKVTATSKNLVDFELVEEDISFNDLPISHTARYCTSQRQSITCEIPTDRFFEKVTCGEGELAPGEGSRYYPLTLTFLVESGGELITISGSKDVSIVARPLEPYLEIADNDVVDRVLQTPINCLGSQTIKLGDTGYVRIMYADLLHPEPKEDDVRWSFRLDAHDDKGKLTSGMGVSPEENATICKFISHQRMGVHRIEDYECSLYLTNKMFQRCANGEGELLITATSGGKKAEGRIKTTIVRDDSKYQIEMEIVSEPMKEIDCQIQSYGEKAPCSFASYSNQNVTIRIYNRNQEVELTDLNLYDFDIDLNSRAEVDANPRVLGNCRKESGESHKYVCPFQIGPVIKLPPDTHNVTREKDTYDSLYLGRVNITVYVKYANNLARKIISRMDGTIQVQPKKTDAMLNAEAMRERMRKTFESFEGIFKKIIWLLSACAVCSAGNKIIDSMKGIATGISEEEKSGETKTNQERYNTCYNNQIGICQARGPELEWVTNVDECDEYVKNYCSKLYPTGETKETKGEASALDKAIEAIAFAITAYFSIKLILEMKDFRLVDDPEEEKSELIKSFESGIKHGFFICVMPRIVAEFGAWLAESDTKLEETFEKGAGVAQGIARACEAIMRFMPMMMMFIQFYMSYLQFEMCMDMVEMQIDVNAQAAAAAGTDLQQAQVVAQSSMTMMNNMMSCFNTFMQALNQLTWTMVWTTSQFGTMGVGVYAEIFRFKGEIKDPAKNNRLEGDGLFQVEVQNICKGGTTQASISISGTGTGCKDSKSHPCTQTTYMPYMPRGTTGMYPYSPYHQQQTGITLEAQINTVNCQPGTIYVTITTGRGESRGPYQFTLVKSSS